MTVKNIEGHNQHSPKEVCTQNGNKPRTVEAVAKEHGVGSNTVLRAAKFSKGVDAAEKIESKPYTARNKSIPHDMLFKNHIAVIEIPFSL